MSREFEIEKEWESSGLPCVVLMTDLGHRCGYVGVPKGHVWFGANYDDVRLDGKYIDVHGGLTYGSLAGKGYPSAKENSLFWFGFDCAHFRDNPDYEWLKEHNPEMYNLRGHFSSLRGGTVKDLAYCVKECESLALQLKESNGTIFHYIWRKFKKLLKWIWYDRFISR
jgi:hypothetical protein